MKNFFDYDDKISDEEFVGQTMFFSPVFSSILSVAAFFTIVKNYPWWSVFLIVLASIPLSLFMAFISHGLCELILPIFYKLESKIKKILIGFLFYIFVCLILILLNFSGR